MRDVVEPRVQGVAVLLFNRVSRDEGGENYSEFVRERRRKDLPEWCDKRPTPSLPLQYKTENRFDIHTF